MYTQHPNNDFAAYVTTHKQLKGEKSKLKPSHHTPGYAATFALHYVNKISVSISTSFSMEQIKKFGEDRIPWY